MNTQQEILQRNYQRVRDRADLLNLWLKKRTEGKQIANFFKNRGIEAVGIYSLNTICERLVEEFKLDENGIRPLFIISKELAFLGGLYDGIPVIDSRLIRAFPETGAVIVSVSYDLESIKKYIMKFSHHIPQENIYLIDDVIREL